ncbi:COX15/CtaA family protein [Pontibacter sp. SGAir0037]|uniref:COX15/CtaA family protein n=1 Tax=Pontibacter sp. SGAir0037 TaxID=2571030 RepID=UPI0010CD13E1|nr:COX15/CtaA family protein [Pontibacter sp. SGAir0037]QCR21585.1 heme A synthase [Pontibacter sp. SGAir0037]
MQKKTYILPVVLWLLTGVLLIVAMMVIGGITRMTGSGLSIVEWNLLSGTLPPLSEAEWLLTFEKYKQFPEYQKLNNDMTLAGFKNIFWWEYLHRLLGRIIGFVFILPFLYFLLRKQLSGWLVKRLLLILLLGMGQGLMGWIMVKSGLVDIPRVSHYRLATHLCLALLLIGVILWTVADIVAPATKRSTSALQLGGLSRLVLLAVIVQIILGAFVAGLKSGFYYNTYPLMQGELFPSHQTGYLSWSNFLNNGTIVQFIHRWFALVALGLVILLWYRAGRSIIPATTRTIVQLLLLTGFVQVLLGITTLLLSVPLLLGVLHQLVAVALFALAVLAVHQLRVKPY